jgi:dihydrofolate synthase/folylpolyglutamate synthase
VITVAGTNGKGSCLALMEALSREQGWTPGLFTSPHLFRFNERIRVSGEEASDAAIVCAFEAIEAARGEVSLTYFEFAALAALHVFARAPVDLALLEVGLGGRLDAVNIVDADVAVIASVGLDHMEWLGNDRETIALEKYGIARPGHPLVYGETDRPASIDRQVTQDEVPLWRAGAEFGAEEQGIWWGGGVSRHVREPGRVPLGRDNLATAVQALSLAGFEPEPAAIRRAAGVELPGRAQHLERDGVSWYLDVGHNREALERFRRNLPPCAGRTHAVAAMLVDKPARLALESFVPAVDAWYLAGLPGERGSGPQAIRAALPEAVTASEFADVAAAVSAARAQARPGDRVLVLGSFRTVLAGLEALRENG